MNYEALLDSGADGIFIPKGLAEALGLQKIEKIETSGVLSKGICYKTRVGIKLGRTKARSVDVGYVDAVFPEKEGDIPILIGRAPIFKIFKITFEEYLDPPSFTLEQV